jgi:glutamate dehydrogenase
MLPLVNREQLLATIQNESQKFKDYFLWLEHAMPLLFFEEVIPEHIILIIHNLMGFDVREYSATIHLKNIAIAMTLDRADADLKILQSHTERGIKHYQAYESTSPPPFFDIDANLRIVVIYFTAGGIEKEEPEELLENKEVLQSLLSHRNADITPEVFEKLLKDIGSRFLHSLPIETQVLAIEMYFRAQSRDQCQYEVRYREDWEAKGIPSMQFVLAWRNTPKHNFLYRLVRVIRRHGLEIKSISVSCSHPYSTNSILLMALELHGANGKAVWEVADMLEFIKEFITVKYFASFDVIDQQFVSKDIISGPMGNFLRAAVSFIHQALVHLDVNLYNLENIEEGLCRHPELTEQLCDAFKYKFSPGQYNSEKYKSIRSDFLLAVERLDTGNEDNDNRRRNVFRQGMNFVHYMLKTNFYRPNYTALSFRLDPKYLDDIPFDRARKFPELPYAIFFIKGMHFIGFHIRFRDLARGGLRTVFPEHSERMQVERNTIFTECYNLAYTQQLKNKDIPEGGAKGIILLMPYERLESECLFLAKELQNSSVDQEEIDRKVDLFRAEQRREHLYQAQRAFIENLVVIVNCDADGRLRARDIIDYWNRPEYLYLGPDENMHDVMIQWIADYSKKYHYKPGSAFISGKPTLGINHKEYGVTSLGVNVYLEAVLRFMGIDPTKEKFTVKMAGGPDGDVAGNEICNLERYYPNTAKLVALTDVTGTIYDPEGLDLTILAKLFHEVKGIRHYPPQELNDEGFLVDKQTKRFQTPLVQQTLCWRKQGDKLNDEWLSGSEMNALMRNNVHKTHADVFIPAGGRPRTLNENNYGDFLDETGKPTSRAIIEGANLYLTPRARRALEEKGVLIVKDSSANKTGVICSSFEVLSGLTLGDNRFLENKPELVKEIKMRLRECAANEADLLLRTHLETGEYLTEISDKISKRINQFMDQLMHHLEGVELAKDPKDPLVKTFLDYCLPLLRERYREDLLREIPSIHKKAIIACHISAQIVYKRGLSWMPSLVDVLPVLFQEKKD